MASQRMLAKGIDKPLEMRWWPYEGHGFYTEEHRREFYVRLLGFLSRNLGGATAMK